MCRNFNVCLSPVKIEYLFFTKDPATGTYTLRPKDVIQADLHDRTHYATALAEDCSKRSTKAGYDAAGMAIGTIPLAQILNDLEGSERGALTHGEMIELAGKIKAAAQTQVKISRDGGDLLKTWDTLLDRVQLERGEFLTNWETHVRQASQGDMYSESNAHPHQENWGRAHLRIYQLSPQGELFFAEP